MKKYILCLATMLLSAISFAQTSRQYMGAYTSDDHSESGLGLTGYPGTYSIVADIPAGLLTAYDGGKVVGMRFAVAEPCNTTKCFVLKYNQSKEDTLAVARVTSSKAGWNEVMFDKPVKLDLSGLSGICIGYDYEQTSTNKPLSVSEEGYICESYIYGDLGSGTGYYNVGLSSYGNLCAQAIVEKEFAQNSMIAFDFEDTYLLKGKSGKIEMGVQNTGTVSATQLDYTITRNGVTSAEKHINLSKPINALVGIGSVNIPIDANSNTTTEEVTITITKINGQANTSTEEPAIGKLITVNKLFPHRVAVEEYTGTGCGWCPRGMQGMENLRAKYGDSFVGIALHQYSSNSRDAMAIATNNYKKLNFSGAPSCMIERGDEMDPYYGSANDIRADFAEALNKVAPVGVEVSGMWSKDKKSVTGYANVEALSDGHTYDIEYVLVADGLKGSSSAWKQSNYYYQYAANQVEDDLQKFAFGGEFGQSSFSGWVFNDVALASSFTNGINKAKTLGTLSANKPVQSECAISIPTSTLLVNAIHYDQVYIVALVIDKSTGKIVNAAKNTIGDETAIEEIMETPILKTLENSYNLSGQRVGAGFKGLIIKNGRKYIQQ